MSERKPISVEFEVDVREEKLLRSIVEILVRNHNLTREDLDVAIFEACSVPNCVTVLKKPECNPPPRKK